MERLPDMFLQQDPSLPDVVDEGHEWYIYLEPAGPHVEPSRTGHDYEEKEPDYVVKVTVTKLVLDPPEKIYEEICRQIVMHYRRCAS